MILLCYDGSEDARAAAEQAAQLFCGDGPVTVLTVWDTYSQMLARPGFVLPTAPPMDDGKDVDSELRQRAEETAREGADVLRRAGAAVEPLIESRAGSVADTILDVAHRLDADAVVMGTRGRGRLKSALLGSVSHGVVQHADRPVMIVPPPGTARSRAGD